MAMPANSKPIGEIGLSTGEIGLSTEEKQVRQSRQRCQHHLDKFLGTHSGLRGLYDEDRLEDAVSRAQGMLDKLMGSGYTREVSLPLTVLTLYDIVVLIDDSSSVNFEQNGERKNILERTLHEITKLYDLANSTGLKSVQFLNAGKAGYNIKNSDVPGIFKYRVYNGPSRIGTELKRKVLDRFVSPNQPMLNPLLVITITDGEIEGEKKGLLGEVITECVTNCPHVVFQFSQVGNDVGGERMLKHLDTCGEVGKSVDCLNVDSLLDNLAIPEFRWHLLTKLLLGAIDEFWDERPANPDSEDECEDFE